MIKHLQTKISKVTNKGGAAKEVSVHHVGATTSPISILQTYCYGTKELAKWNVKVSYYDIVIHAVDQMYESDWFSKDTMTKWGETQDNDKTWSKCQKFSEDTYIARKRYNNTKDKHKKPSTKLQKKS